MRTKEDIKAEVLSRSLKDVLADLGDGLSIAGTCGDVVATNAYATKINNLKDIVDMFVEAECEAEA